MHPHNSDPASQTQDITWCPAVITAADRARLSGHAGRVIWLTGLPGSGKSTIARALEGELFRQRKLVYVLDGDNVRHGLCSDLGFSPEDRKENIRRVGEVAKLLADAGIICIAAFISPYRADRQIVREIMRREEFIEVYVNATVEVCERRDPKGLYARARAGLLKDFTGISAPYEPPENPDVELRTDQHTVAESVELVVRHLGSIADGSRQHPV
jgi:adenylyl-sulfate kinase